MRRSAAPSQLHKRLQGQFKPPFSNPAAKRVCVSEVNSDAKDADRSIPVDDVSSSMERTSVRSSSAILSLLKKQPSCSDVQNINSTSESSAFGDDPVSTSAQPIPRDSDNISSSNFFAPRNQVQDVLSPNNHNKATHLSSPDLHSRKSPAYVNSFTRPVPDVTRINLPKCQAENLEPQQVSRYYSVVWCKRSNKKHKKWEGDAVLIVKGRSVILKDTEGKDIGQSSGYRLADLANLEDGSTLPVGGKEVEIQGVISAEEYSSGQCFQMTVAPALSVSSTPPPPVRANMKPFRLPTKNSLPSRASVSSSHVEPLHNPTHPDALVMPRPPSQHQWRYNAEKTGIVDVVVDPYISKKLRPHQSEGVIFLYECVMGYKLSENFGAILADEMGLGKTLQCIALVWTLLKQGPYGRRPVINSALIVSPSSLCANWGKEFKKWLGKERIGVYIVDQNNKVEQYIKIKEKPVMIISYEMFVRYSDTIDRLKFDLLLCDEGHRLKNSNIKTANLLASLSCKRRVILTGTPVQNDLKEFYALVEFVNPGAFGSPASFRHIYEEPIIASQQPGASDAEKELGASRASQLNRITSLFTLRRTQEIINRYLPPKVEFVVFCQPSQTQLTTYNDIIGCRSVRQLFSSMDVGDHLSAILSLRKLCNHPALLAQSNDDEAHSDLATEIANLLPSHIEPHKFEESDSGKLAVVSCILWSLIENGNEKIVIVSNYTSTLDMLAQLCEKYSYCYVRLDGSTPTSKRQDLVDHFNTAGSKPRVFLLSAKAGGVGLNLVGASRILLYDIDWNPATDLQAMARVWRDGQRRKVYIYRLLMTGSLDEKIYQRQVKKQSLSGTIVDARDSEKAHFSTAELKDLFTLHGNTSCLTHDLLNCMCDLSGSLPFTSQIQKKAQVERVCQLQTSGSSLNMSNTTMDQLQDWCHIGQPFNPDVIKDHCLEAAFDFITFVFRNESSYDTSPF